MAILFSKCIASTPWRGRGLEFFCGGGGGIFSADVRTEWDLKISLALPEVQRPSIFKMLVMPGCYENLIH